VYTGPTSYRDLPPWNITATLVPFAAHNAGTTNNALNKEHERCDCRCLTVPVWFWQTIQTLKPHGAFCILAARRGRGWRFGTRHLA